MTYKNVFNPEISFLFNNELSQQVVSGCDALAHSGLISNNFSPFLPFSDVLWSSCHKCRAKRRAGHSFALPQNISNSSIDHNLHQVCQPTQVYPCWWFSLFLFSPLALFKKCSTSWLWLCFLELVTPREVGCGATVGRLLAQRGSTACWISCVCFVESNWSQQMHRRHVVEVVSATFPPPPLEQRHLFHQLLGVLAAEGLAGLVGTASQFNFHPPNLTCFNYPCVLVP